MDFRNIARVTYETLIELCAYLCCLMDIDSCPRLKFLYTRSRINQQIVMISYAC